MKLPCCLTKDQVMRMGDRTFGNLKKNAIRDKPIIEVLFTCGLRSNELINLRIEDIREEYKEEFCGDDPGNRKIMYSQRCY
jgi:site-specific recombinase XerD